MNGEDKFANLQRTGEIIMYEEFVEIMIQLGAIKACGEYWLEFKIEEVELSIVYDPKNEDVFDLYVGITKSHRVIINDSVLNVKGFVEFLMKIVKIKAHAIGMSDALDEIRVNYNK